MTGSISPYALLCQSRPKPVSIPPTAYDLYSMTAQESRQAAAAAADAAPAPPAAAPMPAQQTAMPAQIAKRTHYIADIHARHSTAFGRARQSSQPL